MRKTAIAAMTALIMLLGATTASAHTMEKPDRETRRELRQVRRATAKYFWLSKALTDEFVPFAIPEELGGTLLTIRGEEITCFDSGDGGMGVHYVRNIDGNLDATDPEALVYEVTKRGRLRLVAVEYIVPEELYTGQTVLGRDLHHHSYLPVYILHAWVWKWNPDGVFADFNPRVRDCPS